MKHIGTTRGRDIWEAADGRRFVGTLEQCEIAAGLREDPAVAAKAEAEAKAKEEAESKAKAEAEAEPKKKG